MNVALLRGPQQCEQVLGHRRVAGKVGGAECQALENRRVLLVDDDRHVRKSGAHILESLGCRVVLAEDGREGVERFQEHHEDLALVLLDMVMPNMSGHAAFEAMRGIDDRVPIILCSGYVDDVVVRAMRARGLAGMLTKPFRFVQLTELVNEIARDGLGLGATRGTPA